MAAGVQGSSALLVDLSVGSVLRALLEACAATALWMQWLILQVLATTRASTSAGSDLDTWMADFGLLRLAGAPSSGQVAFGRYTPGIAAIIPVGTQVLTTDRSQLFQIIAEPTNLAWNGNSGYIFAASASYITLPVQAISIGEAGNVLPGSIGILLSGLPGVDTVSNAQSLVGGVDVESDEAFRLRFQLYINSRSQCTIDAVENAIASLQQGLRYSIFENVVPGNIRSIGSFWVVIDDGTGQPSDTLISAASAAVSAVRPIGSNYAVTGPTVLDVDVEMYIVTSDPVTLTSVQSAVQLAISSWAQSLPIGGTLAISKLEAIAHNVDASVLSIVATTINGFPKDVTASSGQVIRLTSLVVN